MIELYRQIAQLVPTLHGWCEVEKAIGLANLVLATKPATVVEIGTWGGRSLIPMMLAGCDDNEFTAIDPWSPEASVNGQVTDTDRDWWSSVANHDLVLSDFKRVVDSLAIGQRLRIHRQKSSDFKISFKQWEINILHIDGNHGPEAIDDAKKFAPHVSEGGYCVLDDLNWAGGYVLEAEKFLIANGFLKLHPLGTGAVYLRI